MIDNPEQAERLLTKLQAALPLRARMTPELAATLRTPDAAMAIPAACSVIAVHYAGDEGGIACGLDVVTANEKAVYASITHLRFDPRLADESAQAGAGLVMMHSRGTPETMHKLEPVADVLAGTCGSGS